jgi:hypothetical protein
MGEGLYSSKTDQGWVEETGFNGFIEVEIFSNACWKEDQSEFLNKIINAYRSMFRLRSIHKSQYQIVQILLKNFIPPFAMDERTLSQLYAEVKPGVMIFHNLE